MEFKKFADSKYFVFNSVIAKLNVLKFCTFSLRNLANSKLK